MKATSIHIRGLRCDKPGCGYRQDEPISNDYNEWAKWLNAPCPLCSSPLLTEADLRTTLRLLRVSRIINMALWPFALFSNKKKAVTYDLGMNGTGSINPKQIE